MRKTHTRRAVQFGAGNIGRGFLGQLLYEGGYHTTFVDANAALVASLNERGGYPLRLAGTNDTRTLQIGRLSALEARDGEAVTRALLDADLVSLAVGVNVLPAVAPTLAAGLNARVGAGRGPLDILLCENQWHAATLMRDLLLPHIAPDAQDYFGSQVGLVETVIGRMVPTPTSAIRAEDPLLVVAEPYQELPVARVALRGPAPKLPGLVLAERFEAYEARKLFVHNMGHAALAYLGWERGHEFIWQCVADESLAETCAGAMSDTCRALAAEYGFGPGLLSAFADDLVRRFANRALGDTVARVAADPLRKLRPDDRLVGAARLCLVHGIAPVALGGVLRAALRYDNPADPGAVRLQTLRRELGDAVTLEQVCGIGTDSPLLPYVSERPHPSPLLPQGEGAGEDAPNLNPLLSEGEGGEGRAG